VILTQILYFDHHVNLNHAYEELEAIVEQVSVQLDIGCVVEQLER